MHSFVRTLATTGLVLLSWLAAKPAAAAEAASPPTKPEFPWFLPPCALPEADGPFRLTTACSGTFGARATVNVTRAAGAGLSLAAEGEELVRRGLFSVHTMHRIGLGGGGSGFDGVLLASLAVGIRAPVGPRHGPFVRGGALAYVRGNDDYYGSLLDIPRIEAGYQYQRGITVLELGATGGVVHGGKERDGATDARSLGLGVEVGAYALIQRPWLRFSARWMRLPTQDNIGGSVRLFESVLCGVVAPVAICGDLRAVNMWAQDDRTRGLREVLGIYTGVSLGFTRER